MDAIKRAATAAAYLPEPPESITVPGVLDLEQLADLSDIAAEVIRLQKAADGTLDSCRRLLAQLYVYDYTRCLQPVDENKDKDNNDSDEGAPTDNTEGDAMFAAALCAAVRPSRGAMEECWREEDGVGVTSPTPNLAVLTATTGVCLRVLRGVLAASPTLLDGPSATAATSTGLRTAVAVAIATWSDVSTGWSTEATARVCAEILQMHHAALTAEKVLVVELLGGTVKPVFAGTRVPTVTEMGRKAVRVPVTRREVEMDEAGVGGDAVWLRRKGMGEALAVVRFVIAGMEPRAVQENWHLIAPPVLTALDAGDILTKAHACDVLADIITAVDAAFLARTGLGSVFEQAVIPCLHFLPPLTPTNHAARAFSAGVNALVALARRQGVREGGREGMYKALDGVLRDGVFRAVTYVGENVRMMETVVTAAGTLVRELGVRSVRHLSKLVSMCAAPMLSPFVGTHPQLARAATATLVEVVRACWPRVPAHNAEILKAAVFCWMRGGDGQQEEVEVARLRHELRTLMALLERADGDSGWFERARGAVVEREAGLAGLFA